MIRAEWQETLDLPSCTGTAPSVMKKEWPQFDWSTIDPVYPKKTGIYEPSNEASMKRGIEARRWLRSRKERVIAVVSHGTFLQDFVSYGGGYGNAECRIFDFEDGHKEIGGMLVEWELTECEVRGLGTVHKGKYEWSLGLNDTSALHTINSLGVLYANQGKLAEAKEMYQRALKGYKTILGSNHIWTLVVVNNLRDLCPGGGDAPACI